MAGGGVGEAMAIGALMGAGTGGIMAATQDKDPLQGALLGAVTGAATGAAGSAIGGAAGGAGGAAGGAGGGAGGAIGGVEGGVAGGGAGAAGGAGGSGLTGVGDMLTTGGVQGGTGAGVGGGAGAGAAGGAGTGGQTAAQWMNAGKGAGWATNLTNAQAYGAGAAGGIGGLYSASQMPGQQEWPTGNEDEYSGSLSYFKYDPTKYRPDTPTPRVYEAGYRGMADGGIASLNPMSPMSNTVYPQSQQTQTAFSTSPQYPNSIRSAMASDYDTRTNPTLGTEMPMGYAAGGIARYGFGGEVEKLQPGGWFGDLHGKTYGAIADATGIDIGGAGGALTPGANQYHAQQREERERKESEERQAREAEAARQATIARNTGMNANMARGGIASLGGYSDGGQLLRGPGDGVSDSIPASIGGKQPARLADGEFVVPSRIVSELGNGSTDAGARRLYDMMDRVQARRSKTMGKGKVAKNTRAYQELPA